MKQLNTLLALLLCAVVTQVNAQAQEGRFLQEVFTDVSVTNDVTYGVNATLIALPFVGEAIPEELKLDIYEPMGDDDFESRPLVLVAHSGNFLPVPQNASIIGTRRDSSVVEVCTRLAKMGYVAAAISYRQGWNPLAPTQPDRALGLIQAAYRGVQDARTAVRFFKRTAAENGNPYRIDSDRITVWGNGTGGYVSLAAASLDQYSEIITTTNGPGKFLLDLNEDSVPETPMLVESIHGDVEGKTVGVDVMGVFGVPAGDTLSYPNHVDYSSDFQLCVNIGGDIGDISWVDEKTPPMIIFQSAFDIFAPYDDGVLVVPTTNDPIVRVQGGKAIMEKATELGLNQVFIDANIDDVFTEQAKNNSALAEHEYFEGLSPTVLPPNALGIDEGVVIDWWDPEALAPSDPPLPWNQLPHPAGGTFHEQGMVGNMGMSAEKARANLDTIFGYFTPRAYAALDLAPLVNVKELASADVKLSVQPNPATNMVLFSSEASNPILDVELYDLNGRLLRTFRGVDNSYFFLHRQDLRTGLYVAKVRFESGIVAKRIIFE
ncbi:MAG: T9SS type A sorting domain-containing protein [Bacteroidota bacterium]